MKKILNENILTDQHKNTSLGKITQTENDQQNHSIQILQNQSKTKGSPQVSLKLAQT